MYSVYDNIRIDVIVCWIGCVALHETGDFRERMENSSSAADNIGQRIQTKLHCLRERQDISMKKKEEW